MSMLHSRRWVIARRIVLVAIVLLLGYRIYGDALLGWRQSPDPAGDIVVARSEFRPDSGGDRPFWFIALQNNSSRFTYNQILLEATYTNNDGVVTHVDRMMINQAIAPGASEEIGSPDPHSREGATRASLQVIDAEVVR